MGSNSSSSCCKSSSQCISSSGKNYQKLPKAFKKFIEKTDLTFDMIMLYSSTVQGSLFCQQLNPLKKQAQIIVQSQSSTQSQTDQNGPSMGLQHHQIICRSGHVYVLLSWGKDGLQSKTSISYKELAARRKQNRKIRTIKVNFDSNKIVSFLKEHLEEEYSLISWNCQHFCEKFIEFTAN